MFLQIYKNEDGVFPYFCLIREVIHIDFIKKVLFPLIFVI